ncbi:Tubulin alpha-3E chain [Sciurus carolinensis]|uniref:Tubulin alpha-3E chain n=1 Tax=Sciurus carolinensis TaxID=30640 RepID=A0AA41MXP5_SCICA|nr:Tubulin alpha-3E chain [Sciurus carolinensis]
MGNVCWEFYRLEHNIQPDGTMPRNKALGSGNDPFNTFFNETGWQACALDCLCEPGTCCHRWDGAAFYRVRQEVQVGICSPPSPPSGLMESYNSILTTHTTLEHSDCAFMVDNEAIDDVYHCKEYPTSTNLNWLIGQIVTSITASLCFDGTLNMDFMEFQTNMVP